VLGGALKRAFRPRPYQVVAAVTVFAAVLLLVRFTTVNSEVYEFADAFVAQDKQISTLTGTQDERSLRWLRGFSMTYGDKNGEASLTMQVIGERGKFNVPLTLQKREGRWAVVNAKAVRENGETVVIVE
jgi:hypothetical protein